MSDRVWWAIQVSLVVLVAAWIAQAQDATPQPDLDLPVRVEARGATAAPVTTQEPTSEPNDQPLPVFFGEVLDSRDNGLVYVIDCSGSMAHRDRGNPTGPRTGPSRMEKAKAELVRSIGGLAEGMRFNVVTYSTWIKSLWAEPQVASESNKAEAIAWVAGMQPDGLTATGPATVVALNNKTSLVVLLTDGVPTCPFDDPEWHRRIINGANSQRAQINVFAIQARSEWRAFCQNVARDSAGSYYDVP